MAREVKSFSDSLYYNKNIIISSSISISIIIVLSKSIVVIVIIFLGILVHFIFVLFPLSDMIFLIAF